MRVRVLEVTRAYWNYGIAEFAPGEELSGDLARHLAANAPKDSVEVIEADLVPEQVAPEPEPPAGADDGEGDVPPVDGTVDDLMTWVDGDPARAAAALVAEQAKDKVRSTVVKRLAALAG